MLSTNAAKAKLNSPKAHMPNRTNCFPAGTPVWVERGIRGIDKLVVGDRVWAYDFPAREWRLTAVTETFRQFYVRPRSRAWYCLAGQTSIVGRRQPNGNRF